MAVARCLGAAQPFGRARRQARRHRRQRPGGRLSVRVGQMSSAAAGEAGTIVADREAGTTTATGVPLHIADRLDLTILGPG